MENRKRNVQIIIRITEEERALIEEKMEVKGHTAQLQKIGVNVNQIAKRINETGRIYADDMDRLSASWKKSGDWKGDCLYR